MYKNLEGYFKDSVKASVIKDNLFYTSSKNTFRTSEIKI